MRVAILNPMFGKDFTKSARWFARSRGRVQRHPDYLAYGAAVVEEAGHDILFVDNQAKNLSSEEFLPDLKKWKPDLVVCQTSTPSIYADIESARLFKDATGATTVFVGSHSSAVPDQVLTDAEGAVDACAVGEFDYTIRDLANGVSLKDCEGLARWDNGSVVRNPDRAYIENLDDMPFPAWQHLNIYDYRDGAKLYPFLTSITGRGCRYRCSYCQIPQVMNGHVYRTRSVENVVDEMERNLKLFPDLKEIMFEDDTLTMRIARDRLIALCEEIIRRDLPLSWSANARVDLNDVETLKLMKRSGCRMLCVGFEFGDQTVLNNVKKGTTVDQMYTFAENARKAKLRIHGCFMFGGPGETLETARKTISMSQELKIDTAQFTGVVAYPGTTYYDWAKEGGHLIPENWRDWVDDEFEQKGVVNLPNLSKEDIAELVDEGLRKFYLRPSQMCRMAVNIQDMADVKAKLHGLKSFISYFSAARAKPFDGFTGNN
jgi:radical SAM superfamily enzyme YgiQ (UPF0313 family)